MEECCEVAAHSLYQRSGDLDSMARAVEVSLDCLSRRLNSVGSGALEGLVWGTR